MEIGKAKCKDFTMEYIKFGHGKKDLVMLPGLSVDSIINYAEMVTDAYRLLTDDFTIYLFDRRREVSQQYSIREMAEDTVEAIKSLGLEQFCLVGASQGGMISLEIAINHPEPVTKLIMASSTPRVTDEQYKIIEKWIQLAKSKEATSLYLNFGKMIYPESLFEQLKNTLVETSKSVTDNDLEHFIVIAEGIKGFDVTDDLEKIKCPMLAIGSRDDKIFGADGIEQMKNKLGERKDFEMYLYDNYGHAAYDVAPDFKERILKFFNK